jgi:hypothetical protein
MVGLPPRQAATGGRFEVNCASWLPHASTTKYRWIAHLMGAGTSSFAVTPISWNQNLAPPMSALSWFNRSYPRSMRQFATSRSGNLESFRDDVEMKSARYRAHGFIPPCCKAANLSG